MDFVSFWNLWDIQNLFPSIIFINIISIIFLINFPNDRVNLQPGHSKNIEILLLLLEKSDGSTSRTGSFHLGIYIFTSNYFNYLTVTSESILDPDIAHLKM